VGSALLGGAVALIVVGNLGIGEVNRSLHFLTVDQAWDVFAPDPVSTQAELDAVVDFADGREEVWRPPRTRGAMALMTYHWDMWSRVAMLGYPPVADATARWVAARYRGRGAKPVRVTLRRSWYRVPPPGTKHPHLWHQVTVWVRDFER
jgi:hypothetical protein